MGNSVGVIPIYPAGRGHYALGSPDGSVLQPGQRIEIVLAGHQIAGTVRKGEQSDYLLAEDGTICGLCACMCVVVASANQEVEGM
ncbi:MAG: hypothetical protein ABI413_02260 [Ktedonobacteraceae bacterium]